MKDLTLDMDIYTKYVSHNSNTDLFVSTNQMFNIEYNETDCDIRHSFITGLSTRVFSNDCVRFYAKDGLLEESICGLIKNPVAKAKFPPSILPEVPTFNLEKINGKIPLLDFSEETLHALWTTLSSYLSEKNTNLNRLLLHCQLDFYYHFLPCGNIGYSQRMLFAPGIVTKNSPNLYFDIFPEFTLENIFKLADTTINVSNLPMVNYELDFQYIVFANTAACDLLFYFTKFLSDSAVSQGNSFVRTSDVGKKRFSDVLSIEENSEKNKAISGSVDGEGVHRKTVKIIDQGVITSLFSGSRNGDIATSTGSVYRFSHTDAPRIQASKVALLGNNTLKSVIATYNDILFVDCLNGLQESISADTSSFEAFSLATIIKDGNAVKKCNIRIHTSIDTIYKNVICVTNDAHYGGSGTILSGAILVSNKNMLY